MCRSNRSCLLSKKGSSIMKCIHSPPPVSFDTKCKLAKSESALLSKLFIILIPVLEGKLFMCVIFYLFIFFVVLMAISFSLALTWKMHYTLLFLIFTIKIETNAPHRTKGTMMKKHNISKSWSMTKHARRTVKPKKSKISQHICRLTWAFCGSMRHLWCQHYPISWQKLLRISNQLIRSAELICWQKLPRLSNQLTENTA